METQMATWITQFGVAGLIGWMWITERRAGAQRESQLTESHNMLRNQRDRFDALLRVVEDNTRAMTALETGHRAVANLLARIERSLDLLAPPLQTAGRTSNEPPAPNADPRVRADRYTQ